MGIMYLSLGRCGQLKLAELDSLVQGYVLIHLRGREGEEERE